MGVKDLPAQTESGTRKDKEVEAKEIPGHGTHSRPNIVRVRIRKGEHNVAAILAGS